MLKLKTCWNKSKAKRPHFDKTMNRDCHFFRITERKVMMEEKRVVSRTLVFAFFLVAAACQAQGQQAVRVNNPMKVNPGDYLDKIKLPLGFKIEMYAENVEGARWRWAQRERCLSALFGRAEIFRARFMRSSTGTKTSRPTR